MKLFIANEFNMKPYKLPDTPEESFMISYISEIDKQEKMIYIQAVKGRWRIEGNLNISLYYNNLPQNSITLEEYKTFCICFNDVEEYVFLFCMPSNIGKYFDLDIPITMNEILIGSGPNNNLVYNNPMVNDSHIVLSRDDKGIWTIRVTENSPAIYVNKVIATNQKINCGDEIFVFGLKIIWMKRFIRINEIPGTLTINRLSYFEKEKADNSRFTPATAKEKNQNLYKESEYFFHTPSLKPVIENKEIAIEPPPPKETDDNRISSVMAIGTSITMSFISLLQGVQAIQRISRHEATWRDELATLVTVGAMVLASVAFPILTEFLTRAKAIAKENKRRKKYSKYLDDKKLEIKDLLNKQALALKELYPSTSEIVNMIEMNTRNIWNREIKDKEFLSIRLGTGTIKAAINIDYPKRAFTMSEDKLEEKVNELVDSEITIANAPIVESLTENNVFPIILNCYDKKSYIDNIMLQLISFHSSYDLKIVFMVNERNSYIWDIYKYLSHTISHEMDERFFAYTEEEVKDISSYLDIIYQSRVSSINNQGNSDETTVVISEDDKNKYKKFDTYYIIVTDDIIHCKGTGIINKILKTNNNYGFSILMFETAIKNLPSRCNEFVNISDTSAEKFNKDLKAENQISFTPDYAQNIDMPYIISKLSNIPVASPEAASQLPSTLEFLEMYKVGRIEQLNILNRWQMNDPTLSLSAPIGVHPDGNIFELNLHEKNHGPHGLVAGSTGSGKSEFIITYILSMCINYSPNEVQFVLIDYKGGGLAGAFENREKGIKIPHLVGTITNLDTSEMNRTLVSIRSELKRRQRVFNEVRDALGESTIDIYKYQKYFREGSVREPIAHLFIISDEFAELKAQQPDFMDELISTARIGRSLGVHLILATQKPSGVVDDQIWSNTKFKICLKVQSASDSVEMLKRPEAASLKEAGRFYLQVGYDEIFEIGQSAWSGAKYIPTDVITKKIDDSIEFINNVGTPIKKINNVIKKEETQEMGEQLTNIVKYLVDLATKEKINTNQLWLPSIPNEIYIGNIIKKYNFKPVPFKIEAVIGEYDDPENQYQNILKQDILGEGNTIIYGIQGCGKENLLTTMMYSVCMYHSPNEVNFYILDFGAEILKVFGKMPQVGEYLTAYDDDKVPSLFDFLEKEMAKRKSILSDFGGSFEGYNEKAKEKLPLIVVITNNYDSYVENFEETVDAYVKLLREGPKVGIIFFLTAVSQSSVTGRISQNFSKIYAMRFMDEYDFRFLLNTQPGQVPKKVFGRGLTPIDERVLEFQTALVNVQEELNETIKKSAVSLAGYYKEKARPIPVLPGKVNHMILRDEITDSTAVPIGISLKSINTAKFDFENNNIVTITGNDVRMGTTFLEEFLKVLADLGRTNIVMLDLFRTTDVPNGITATTDPEEFFEAADGIILSEEQPDAHRLVVITGVSELFTDEDNAPYKEKLYGYFKHLEKSKKTSYILIDDYFDYKKVIVESDFQKYYDDTTGIWLGTGVDNQVAFSINGLTTEDTEQYTDNIGYLIVKGKYDLIKIMESDDTL